MLDTNYPKEFLRLLKLRLPEMLSTVRRLVLAESPSLEKEPADRCCGILAAEWHKRGASVERIAQKIRGDQLRVTWWPQKSRPAGQFLVLGHYDTVYSSGALAKMPFRISGGKVYGPGIFDMKAGLTQALFALDALQQTKVPLRHRLVFLWTSDEEIGSDASRKLIETEARRSDAVFVLEPSLGPKGLIKTARKGVGEAEIIVHGRASHAGLAPQEGVNAIHELSRQLTRIQEWNDLRRGVTVNADVIEGGTRVNVIAERARAVLDLRALRVSDMRRIERKLHALRPILPGAKLEVRGGFNRAPLEHKSSAALFAKAKELAVQMGLSLGECTAGGGSDGNLTAAVGALTLDGLGAVGHGAHSKDEHIVVDTMPARAALLAALLLNS
jgi:glutamate carboxypeptidase